MIDPNRFEDIGAVDATGNETYIIGNPGRGLAQIQFPSGATPLGQPVPRPKRTYDALELQVSRRFSGNYFWSAGYVYSGLDANYSGLAASEEIRIPPPLRDAGGRVLLRRQRHADDDLRGVDEPASSRSS